MRHRILLVLGAMALIVSSSASGETESIHEEIPWKGEKLVEVEIDFGAGDLTLSAGSGDLLLDADIETPEDAPRPKILYQVSADKTSGSCNQNAITFLHLFSNSN